MSNTYKAVRDDSGIDFMPYRVLLHSENGGRMIARCDSAEDAQMIAEALGGTSDIKPLDYNTLMAKIDEALGKNTKQGDNVTSTPDKVRIVL